MVVGGVNGHHCFLGFVSKLQEHELLEETHFFVTENKTKHKPKENTMCLTGQEKELKPREIEGGS